MLEVTLDDQGRAVSLRPAGLAETRLEYDANGRLSRASRSDGVDVREVRLGYDGANRWASSATDGAMASSRMSHDGLGRATSLTEPSTATATLGYDDATRRLTVAGFDRALGHTQRYDTHGRLASYTPPAVTGEPEGATHYEYDPDGVPSQLTLPDGSHVAITLDAAGRPEAMALSAGTLTLGYDGATGQLATLSMPNAAGAQDVALSYDGPLLTQQRYTGPATADVDFGYDDLLRMTSTTVAGDRVAYGYDRDGRMTQAGVETLTRDPDSGVVTSTTAATGRNVHQIYATSGLRELNLHSATWSGGGSFSESIDSRDGVGRILEKTETGGVMRGYRYDADGRVTEERRGGVVIASYVYDPQGNRTELHRFNPAGVETESRVASYDARDRLLDDGLAAYTYDEAGRRASKTMTSTGDVTRYSYDELGHLTRVELPTGATVEYTYDGAGRRTGRTTDGAVDGPNDTAWVYGAGPAPLAALTGDGTLRATYTYGTRSWVPDAVHIQNGPETADDYVLISDHRGSVRVVIGGITTDRSDYDAFGRRTGLGITIVGFGFAGGIDDLQTGLVHLGARDYDPQTGTWIEPDPIRFGGGDTNLYAYVGGDPVNFVDPSGYIAPVVWGILIALVLYVGSDTPGQGPDTDAEGFYTTTALNFGFSMLGPKLLAPFFPRTCATGGSRAARGGAQAVRVGQAGEAAVRSVADIGEKVLIRVGGRGRIPDGLTSTVLSEVKNVSSLSYTQQLRDFAAHASANGLRFDLWVRPTTQMSGPLLDAIEAGAINRRFIP